MYLAGARIARSARTPVAGRGSSAGPARARRPPAGGRSTILVPALIMLIALHLNRHNPVGRCAAADNLQTSHIELDDHPTNPDAPDENHRRQLFRLSHSNAAAAAAAPRSADVSAPANRGQAPAGELPEFEAPIGNQTVAVGKDAQFSCRTLRMGAFKSAWLRAEDRAILTIHNATISRNYRISLAYNDNGRNSLLTIRNVQPSDRGGYMCQINSLPVKYSVGYLNVLTPPVFSDEPAPAAAHSGAQPAHPAGGAPHLPEAQPLAPPPTSLIVISEGASVNLSCRASGNPAPTIVWRREDNEPILANGLLEPSSSAKFEGPTLSLSSVSRLSSGAYLCIATNGVSPSASRRQTLDVQFAPVVRLPQTELGGQLGQPEVRLVCHVELNPAGSYHWLKIRQAAQPSEDDSTLLAEHNELTNSDKFDTVIKQVSAEKVQMSLTVRRLDAHDFAWYRCIAKNALGTQSSSIRLYESAPGTASGDPGTRAQPAGSRAEHAPPRGQTSRQQAPATGSRSASSWLKSRAQEVAGEQANSQFKNGAQRRLAPALYVSLLLLAAGLCWARAALVDSAGRRRN